MSLVSCTDVARTYGSGTTAVVAVHGVSCSVDGGARIAITGPSGSGKSTLLQLMAGLDRPTAGTLTWPDISDRRSGISMVFQGPSLIPALDALENAALPLLLAGEPESAAFPRARDALVELGLAELAGKLVHELSGGQAQRVAVARVLASRPQLILADEPTGQLDHEAADRLISALLRAAHRLGAAVVVATHDPLVADRFGEQWRMVDGALETSAVPVGHA
jgi:putative ABC transport system ATP-binding protein